jgi:Domain of unknown function (DUF4376)
MQYVIVQNRQVFLLGPVDWRPRFIQSEFDDLEIPYQVPPTEQGYINIDQALNTGTQYGVEIFPVASVITPDIDPLFQHPVGPFWSFANEQATMTWQVTDADINEIKGKLKNMLADARYTKEIAGTTAQIQGQTVALDTSRDARLQYTYSLASWPSPTSTVNWKFGDTWIALAQSDMQTIVQTVTAYIQAQFDWETQSASQIDAATDIPTLQTLKQQLFPVATRMNQPGIPPVPTP